MYRKLLFIILFQLIVINPSYAKREIASKTVSEKDGVVRTNVIYKRLPCEEDDSPIGCYTSGVFAQKRGDGEAAVKCMEKP